jgi:hypothetical protein
MNYEQRVNQITKWFKTEVAIRYNMPRDIDPKVAAMDVIESINATVAGGVDAERMGYLLASTAKEVSRSAHSRTLPTVKMFVDAARNASKTLGAVHTAPPQQFIDPIQLNAKRVLSGDHVPADYLTGLSRQRLLDETSVTEADLEPYDLYIAAHKQ